MDITAARTLAVDLMTQHGLIEQGWTFEFNTNQSRMGVCRYTPRRIEVSRHYAAAATEAEVRDTILHEIAHALVGPGHRHGMVWKDKAIMIGATPRSRGKNPYADQRQQSLAERAVTSARSHPLMSNGLPMPTPYGQKHAPGTRVVVTGRGEWAGRVLVVTKANRTRYTTVIEATGKTVTVPMDMVRLHIEGEPLHVTTPDYTMNGAGAVRADDPDHQPRAIATQVPYVPSARTAPRLVRGDRAVIVNCRLAGSEVEVIRVNPKTCTVRLLSNGAEYRVSWSLLEPVRQAA